MTNINYLDILYIYIAVTGFRKEVCPNYVNDGDRYRKYQCHHKHINYLKEEM